VLELLQAVGQEGGLGFLSGLRHGAAGVRCVEGAVTGDQGGRPYLRDALVRVVREADVAQLRGGLAEHRGGGAQRGEVGEQRLLEMRAVFPLPVSPNGFQFQATWFGI
jgi:hypothetical protein